MALLGMRERVLSSDFVWLCSTLCLTRDICYQLCPKHVRINDIMNVVKNMAVQEGYRPNKLIGVVCKEGRDRRAR